MTAIAYPQRQRMVLELLAPPAPEPAVRRVSAATYRRRRLVVFAVPAAALVGLAAAIGVGSPPASRATTAADVAAARPAAATAAGTAAPAPAAPAFVVRPGDTLWSLARRVQPEGDVRPLVRRLSAARSGRPLQVGEQIALHP